MGEIALVRHEEADDRRWDDFVSESVNGTLFHRRGFLAYHPPERFEDCSLSFYRGGKPLAVLPAALVRDKGRRVLRSHPGASYGGLVVAKPPGVRAAVEMARLLVEWGRAQELARIEMRLAPRIFSALPCDEIEFALRHAGFSCAAAELSTCYDVGRLGEEFVSTDRILKTFAPPCARATRKARASDLEHTSCDREEEFSEFWDVLTANLERHEARPTHSREELWDLKRRFPDDVQLFAIRLEGRIVGGVFAFVCNPRAAHVFYFASRPEQQGLRPLNLAVLELIRWAAARKLRFVNFGISTEQGGHVVNWGLFRFKESFGGGGVLRQLWRCEFGEKGA
jgi:hypothetical protein